jgi:hypothetical protein
MMALGDTSSRLNGSARGSRRFLFGARRIGQQRIDAEAVFDDRAGALEALFAQFEHPQPQIHHGRAPHPG